MVKKRFIDEKIHRRMSVHEFKKKEKNVKKSKIQTKYVLVILSVVLVLALIAYKIALPSEKIEDVFFTCGDGGFYNTCSLEKPYFCAAETGNLIERASVCGCDEFSVKQGNSCISDYHSEPKSATLNYVLDGEANEIDFTVYGGANSYVSNISRIIYYEGEEIPFRADFKHRSINEKVQEKMIVPLVKEIQNLAPDDKVKQARIAVSIVQNIPYGFSDKVISFEGGTVNYSRYPYEVLYDNEGICGEKSQFLALLLKELDYGVAIFYFADENHEAVGIKCPKDKSLYNSGYCFVETSGPAIITDNFMEFVGGVRLKSVPEILLISDGISLPDNMPEYKDAKTLKDIRKRNFLGLVKFWKFDDIREKYNLDGVYNLR